MCNVLLSFCFLSPVTSSFANYNGCFTRDPSCLHYCLLKSGLHRQPSSGSSPHRAHTGPASLAPAWPSSASLLTAHCLCSCYTWLCPNPSMCKRVPTSEPCRSHPLGVLSPDTYRTPSFLWSSQLKSLARSLTPQIISSCNT